MEYISDEKEFNITTGTRSLISNLTYSVTHVVDILYNQTIFEKLKSYCKRV